MNAFHVTPEHNAAGKHYVRYFSRFMLIDIRVNSRIMALSREIAA
jgi:hypothetical protein